MSAEQDSELGSELQFLPQWAQEDPAVNKFANFEQRERSRGHRKGGNDRRGPVDRRLENRPLRKDSRGGRERRGGPERRGDPDRLKGRAPRKDDERPPRKGGGRPPRRGMREERPPVPELELKVDFVPDSKGVDALAKEVRLTGRAYPLFQVAQLILEESKRYGMRIRTMRQAGGGVAQRLFVCGLDDSVWLAKEQVVRHVARRHFDRFYIAERTEVDAPKGEFSFVAQCGISGEVLGPPNYHGYQNRLVEFHAERFARMPFEDFKARIQTVRDEAVVAKWLEEAKWRTEYVDKEDGKRRFAAREEAEKDLRERYVAGCVSEVEEFTLGGEAAKNLREPRDLALFLREAWRKQRHFPLQMSTHLSKLFAEHGLQFFKKDKTVTHVAVARPHFLDLDGEPVSDGVKRIVEFIDATPDCTRRQILESVGGIVPRSPEDAPSDAGVEEKPKVPERTPEQKQLIADLHWLIHQGHVLEFANGIIETAKRPRKQVEEKAKEEAATSEVAVEPSTKDDIAESTTTEEPPTTEVAAEAPKSEIAGPESTKAEAGEPSAD
ncbi:MAG: hypothetical protein VX705_02605 [Verrucomicrobiota bacterium]|nr:hypothetical protein [Verrucomicrobiota bacterium]